MLVFQADFVLGELLTLLMTDWLTLLAIGMASSAVSVLRERMTD